MTQHSGMIRLTAVWNDLVGDAMTSGGFDDFRSSGDFMRSKSNVLCVLRSNSGHEDLNGWNGGACALVFSKMKITHCFITSMAEIPSETKY